MPGSLLGVSASAAEIAGPMPGDDIIEAPDVVMDRGFTIAAAPTQVWPWLVQLGKDRAGWYLPRSVERLVPKSHRGLRRLDPRWTSLRPGEVIPDYGGADATFEVASVREPEHIIYRSRRGRTELTWAIQLREEAHTAGPVRTRVQLRLRLAPVRHVRLARTAGEAIDVLTVAGMAAGLRERVDSPTNAVERSG